MTESVATGTMIVMNHRARLSELLVERSVRLGEFTLSSGQRSSYYVDARRTTMTAEGQFLIGKVCLAAISESGWAPTHVGGLTMGADPVAYSIAHASWLSGSPLDAFSVRKEPKDHGTGQQVEGGLPPGARCLVVEDSMTTGSSALKALRILEAHGASIAGVLCLVDREEGGGELLRQEGHRLLAVFSGAALLQETRDRAGTTT